MQFQVSRIAGAMAPSLVVLPSPAGDSTNTQVDGDTQILGLTLAQRAVMAARRAGYLQVVFLKRDGAAEPGATTVRDWNALAETLGSDPATVVIVPATILSEAKWLKRTAATPEPATWASLPNRVVVLGGTVFPAALAALDAHGGVKDMAEVARRLTQSFGAPAAVGDGIDPMVLETRNAVSVAEQCLLRGLIKDTDGFMARHFDRKISLQITRRLASTSITPSQITILSIAIGLAGAPFFLSAHWAWQTVGALLFLLHSIVDGCDGELARLRFQESRSGGLLDFWGDNIVHVAIFGCMAVGWALSSASVWPLWLGAAAVLGTAASAMFVYWKQVRGKENGGPLFTSVSASPDQSVSRVLDTMSSREFIYGIPIVAFLGWTHWVVVLAAIGAPIFLFVLVGLAMRDASGAKAARSLSG